MSLCCESYPIHCRLFSNITLLLPTRCHLHPPRLWQPKMTPGVATCPFRGWGESPILPQPQLISALYLFLKPQLSYSRPESSTSRFVGHLLRSSLSVLHAPRVTSHLLRLGWADSPDMVLPVLKSESLGKTGVSWSPWMHLLSPALVQ